MPFQVIGDEATVLNVTLRRLAVSISSPSSSPAHVSLVEDNSMTTLPASPTDSSGDGNRSTQHPNSIDPNPSMPTSTETTNVIRPTDPRSNLIDENDDDDNDVDVDEERMPPAYQVTSRAASSSHAFGGGMTRMHLSLSLTTCTFVICRLILTWH